MMNWMSIVSMKLMRDDDEIDKISNVGVNTPDKVTLMYEDK